MASTKTVPIMDNVKAYAEKIQSDGFLAHSFENANDFCQFIGSRLDRFPEYVMAVARYDNTVSLAYATMSGEDIRYRVTSADRSRKMAHDCAIDSVNILNRAFAKAGLPPFADIDTTDRSAVADFAGRFTIEAFDGGQVQCDRYFIFAGSVPNGPADGVLYLTVLDAKLWRDVRRVPLPVNRP